METQNINYEHDSSRRKFIGQAMTGVGLMLARGDNAIWFFDAGALL